MGALPIKMMNSLDEEQTAQKTPTLMVEYPHLMTHVEALLARISHYTV